MTTLLLSLPCWIPTLWMSPRPPTANDILLEITAQASPSYGSRLCRLHDVDGDAHDDFAVGLAYGARAVDIRSGRDGTLLRALTDADVGFGRSLGDVGDVDGDGAGDVIVGRLDSAVVCSGATGGILLQLLPPVSGENYAYSVAGVGDMDGDLVPDIAVGAPQRYVFGGGDHYTISTTGPGFVEVRSGATGGLLRTLHGSAGGIAFGGSVCAAGDVDGDGVGDIAVAGFLEPYPFGSISLSLFSGATGSPLWEVLGLGGVLARLGDVDLDGRDDLLVGDPFRSRVFAVSGASGAILWTHYARMELWPGVDRLGTSVAGIGDVDLDGIPDGIAGAVQPIIYGSLPPPFEVGPGYAHVLSGRNGGILSAIVGRSSGSTFGASVASIDDIDQDGRREFLVAEPGNRRVRVFSGDERNTSPQNYCVSAANSSGSGARMGWSGSVGIGANDLVLAADAVLPGHTALLLMSTHASALRLGSWTAPLTNGFECLGSSTHFRVGPVLRADPAGHVQVRFDAQQPPSGPGSVSPGSTWNFQVVYRDPAGFGSRTTRSDALAVTFWP